MLIFNFLVCPNESQRKENSFPRILEEKFFQIWDLWQSFHCAQRIPWPLNLSLRVMLMIFVKTEPLMCLCHRQETKKITFSSNKRIGNSPKVYVSLNLNLNLLRLHFDFLQERLIHRTMWKLDYEVHWMYLWLHPQASFPFPLFSELLSQVFYPLSTPFRRHYPFLPPQIPFIGKTSLYIGRPRNLDHHVNRKDKAYIFFCHLGLSTKKANASSFAINLVGKAKDRDF